MFIYLSQEEASIRVKKNLYSSRSAQTVIGETYSPVLYLDTRVLVEILVSHFSPVLNESWLETKACDSRLFNKIQFFGRHSR